jgi:carboxypeptidase C (cathepsin A)
MRIRKTQYNAWTSANRTIVKVEGTTAAYSHRFKNLQQVLILNAGHMSPMDQPLVVKTFVTEFIDSPF